jgi:putative transposase
LPEVAAYLGPFAPPSPIRPPPFGLRHHNPPSDVLRRPLESAQYTSLAFGQRCRRAGVVPSMGAVGDAYDKALAESLFATLECELVARSRWRTHAEAPTAVFAFVA